MRSMSRSKSRHKSNDDGGKEIKREVLVWAAGSRLPESLAAVLSVRKLHKVRGASKELYQLCLAVQNPPLPSRLLVLKGETSSAFEVAEKYTYPIKDIRKIDLFHDKEHGHMLVIHALGDRKSKWISESSAERLHMALTLQQVRNFSSLLNGA